MSAERAGTWAKAFALLLGGLVFARLFGISVHASFWWLGLLMWTLFILVWQVDWSQPHALSRSLDRKRIALNLHAAAHYPSGWKGFVWRNLQSNPYQFRLVYLLLPILILFTPPLLQEVGNWSTRLSIAVTPRSLLLRTEPPAFATPEVVELRIRAGQTQETAIVAGSVIELRLRGGVGWRAFFENPDSIGSRSRAAPAKLGVKSVNPQGAPVQFVSDLSPSGIWSGSAERLLEELGLDKAKPQALDIEVAEEGNPPFRALLQVLPAPLPIVTLERSDGAGTPNGNSEVDQGELYFSVTAQSETPLTQVELLVRTQSGYRFTMPIGEFAGTDRLEFSANDVRLATIGIPFEDEDVLFVQARAKTFVKGLEGVSPELKFPVRGPSEVRQELIEQLEKILSDLRNHRAGSAPFDPWKQSLSKRLDQASRTAQELGRQSQPARAIEQARASANRLENDEAGSRKPIESRIQDALEALKRNQAEEKTSSWFMKTRSHLDDLAQRDLSIDQTRQEMSEAASDLADDSEELKSALAEVINSPSSGLTLEEKQSALDMLSRDETPTGMRTHAESVALGEKEAALQEGRATLESATNNLGRIMQLIAIARARRIRDARERLQNADASLEEARLSDNQNQQRQETGKAQNQLDGTPQLGEVFDDALSQAQEATRGAGQALQSGKAGQFKEQIDEAQQAIGEALSALQDEERSLREERSEEEGRRFRSAMDAMNAQGQLDSGWRKKIFEEISRLREEGVPADADIIRYLESRLR